MGSERAVDRQRLGELPLFAACSGDELDGVLAAGRTITVVASTAIVTEGERAEHAYVILSGSTTVLRSGEPVATLGPGDLFGETALINGGVRSATVFATTLCELVELDVALLSALPGTEAITGRMLEARLAHVRRDRAGRGSRLPRGEIIDILERVVVAPRAGVFRRAGLDADDVLAAGITVGWIETLGERTTVASPFAGLLMELLALEGEHVQRGQPVAWLRTF